MENNPVIERYTGNIPAGETAEYEFTQAVDVSAVREDYAIKSYTLWTEDGDSKNDTAAITFRYRENVILHGYRSAPLSTRTAISFGSNEPETLISTTPYLDGNNYIYTGGVTDNAIYLYTATVNSQQQVTPANFVKLTKNWTPVSTQPVTVLPMAMAYDYSTDQLLAVAYNSETQLSALCHINVNTGDLIPSVMAENIFITLACNLKGELFGVDYLGNFCSIDKTNGTVQIIANTGVLPSYIQSMTFDHNSGRLFWAMTCDSSNELIEINPLSGETAHYGAISGSSQVVALHTDYIKTAIETPESGNSSYLIYPNPSEGEITISVVPENATIRLLDLSGRTIKTYTGLSGKVKLNLDLTKGIYFIQIECMKEKTTQKLIVK
jgi:hypothetical protein